MKLRVLAAAALATGLAGAVQAGFDNDTLIFAAEQDPGTLDPYFSNGAITRVLSRNIFDSLLYRDPQSGAYKPHLATSVKYVDPTTIDVELRRGIVFQNGEKLDADDLVYTMNYVADPNNKIVASNRTFFIKGAQKTGEYSARILLKRPFAAAFEFLATSIVVYPNEYHAKVGASGMGRKPVGSGPYEVAEFVPGERVVLKKRKDYFGGAQTAGHIGTIVYRRITEANTQMAELLTGGVDLIWRVTPDQMAELAKQPSVAVGSTETIRYGLIMMDAASRSGASPLAKLQVRQAIAHAIDRKAVLERLAGGGVQLLNVPCHPDQAGCLGKGVKEYPYDPQRARKLLAEAGYPNGFELTIWGYHEKSWMEAMMSDLAKVGIRTNLRYVTAGALIKAIQGGQVPFSYISWGSSGINHVSASAGTLFTDTAYSYTGDPQVKALFGQADLTVDEAKRNALYRQALERIMDQAYAIPFFPYRISYAYNKRLNFTLDSDEQLRFWDIRWK